MVIFHFRWCQAIGLPGPKIILFDKNENMCILSPDDIDCLQAPGIACGIEEQMKTTYNGRKYSVTQFEGSNRIEIRKINEEEIILDLEIDFNIRRGGMDKNVERLLKIKAFT